MIYPALARKETFLDLAIDKLGMNPIDFLGNLLAIKKIAGSSSPTLAAGVMLILFFRENNHGNKIEKGEFFFRLLKRSSRVSQAGDLACPGGILHRGWDHIIMRLIKYGIIPLLRNDAGRYARQKGHHSYNAISLFLATAIREAWEEIRLNPYHVRFLGPLPHYALHLYRRTIFPLVCFVDTYIPLQCNYEVEYQIDIPLTAFFYNNNYGTLIPAVDRKLGLPEEERDPLPCFIFKDSEKRENILWGATLFIIASFLRIVLGFEIPKVTNGRIITKTIDQGYFLGTAI